MVFDVQKSEIVNGQLGEWGWGWEIEVKEYSTFLDIAKVHTEKVLIKLRPVNVEVFFSQYAKAQ